MRGFLAKGLVFATLLSPLSAHSQTFGAGEYVVNVSVLRIFSGQGATFVTFSSLPGCASYGGYLSVSWAAANGSGGVDEHRTKQIVATLLYAKATETLMEVRYRRNTASSGWDSCAVDAVYLN